ncbi:MAG: PrsW family glutamic-type intramembrane protease [Bacteroidales bacterium]|nr:PrsW family glutamic-type intramembrane protease [Bacteroidales bacterium]
MIYVQLAVAPVVVILAYIYYRDKYNKEPFWLLFLLFVSGMFSVLPVLGTGYLSDFFVDQFQGLYQVAYTAFIQAAFIEEFWKLLFTFFIVWWAKSFDERFDGIVYAVTVSMGFAVVENILYVTGYGFSTGLLRMITAVPAHAIFGISMGYYLGRARFDNPKAMYLILAFVVPWLMHGIYDFLIMSGVTWMVIVFIGFLILMYIYGFMRLKNLSKYKVKPQQQNIAQTLTTETYMGYSVNPNSSDRGFEANVNSQNNSYIINTEDQYQNVGSEYSGQTHAQQEQHESSSRGFHQTYNNEPNQTQTQDKGFDDDQVFTHYPPKNNLETLAVLHYIMGGFKLLSSLFVLIYVLMGAGMIVGGISESEESLQILGGIFLILGLFGFVLVVAFGIMSILTGKFLSQKKNRMFCLVISVLECFNTPFGTVLGIFTIVEIEKAEVKKLFETA